MTDASRLEDRLARLGREHGEDTPARARKQGIKARLFGDPPVPARIGRFVDLGPIGQGAMGTVRRAYDERLGREVAIKRVLDPFAHQHHDRLLREAQALAKLSHPNVVQIYEVGEDADEVFIAMELVEGTPLDGWQRSRHGWRECLAVYLQAGRGLAAAHEAGLVHRDFKPSNCMRDGRGRVRVLDFGLVRASSIDDTCGVPIPIEAAPTKPTAMASTPGDQEGSSASMLEMHLTATNAVMGTIAYMAPEQLVGRVVDARSDQFSFCVALYEAIYGARPLGEDPRPALLQMVGRRDRPLELPSTPAVPAVVRHALRRGLAGDPAARWPSMDALLQALEPALGASQWRLPTALGAAAVAATLVTAGMMDEAEDACAHAATEVLARWGDAQRHEVRDALLGTGTPHAADAWAAVEHGLDAYAGALEHALRTSCEARSRGSQDAAPPSTPSPCLERRLAALDRVVKRLGAADEALADDAVALVLKLPPVEACTSIDGSPLLTQADALLFEGRERMGDGRFEEARARLEAASGMAQQGDSDEILVAAEANLAEVVGIHLGESSRGLEHASFAVRFADRSRVQPNTRAVAHAAHGNLSTVRGDLDQARSHYERALELLGDDDEGGDPLTRVVALDGLASVLGKQGELALALLCRRRALEIVGHTYGDQHPETALTRANLGALLHRQGELGEAQRSYEDAIDVLERALGSDHADLADPHNGLAAVLTRQGDHAGAEAEYREAIRIGEHAHGPEHAAVAMARYNLATSLSDRGHREAARAELEAALRILHANEPTPQIERWLAKVERELARLHRIGPS
jgi:tetratricopeptide (TPR) repeat protein/tRNA A-37 threonylcarbamoyl transferase component Bud32